MGAFENLISLAGGQPGNVFSVYLNSGRHVRPRQAVSGFQQPGSRAEAV